MSEQDQSLHEAALLIAVPEAEPLVGPFRLQHDPSAQQGIPAHITINYPFLPGVNPEDDLSDRLADLFSGFAAIEFSFNGIRRFPDALYLAPEPVDPFEELIRVVEDHFPESPSYGGQFEEIVPHLTVAQSGFDDVLQSLARKLERVSRRHLPLSCRTDEVWFMDNRTGTWRKRGSFRLGGE